MKRITVGLLVVLGIVTAIVVLLLARPKDGTSPSSPSSAQPAVEPESRSDPIAGAIQIRPRPFDPAAEQPREDDLARVRRHHAIVGTASRLLGEKSTRRLLDKRLSDADLEALRAKVDELERRNRDLEMEYRTAGYKRLEEVYDAGGGVGVEGAFPIAGAGKPPQIIARNASPFDDDPEDATISQTFFSFGGRGPEARVVRLRPNTDEVWGAYVAAHRPKVEELRREVRSTLETYFGK